MLRHIYIFIWVLMGTHLSLFSQLIYNEADTLSLPEVRLEEVEIKALRESGKISRLPVTAGVLDRQSIHENQVNSIKDLGSFVPNVFMPDYGSSLTSPVYIRGVGSRINSPSVGFYVDNIPYFEKSVFAFDLINTERIEVLRGPQGTLYGRNTMGGLINVSSVSPFQPQQTSVALTGGTPTHLQGTLAHNRLLGSSTGMALSAGINRHTGFFKNQFTGEMADDHLSAGSRIRLAHQQSSALHIEFTSHFEHLDQGGYPYAIHNAASGETQAVNYNQPSGYQRQMLSNGFLLRYEAPSVVLQSVTAHQYFADKQSIDQDFTPADLVFAVQQQWQHMVSQELTLRSRIDSRHQWVTGIFAFGQDIDNDLRIHFGQDAVAAGMVPALLTRYQFSNNRLLGAAAFHQSSISDFLLPGLTLTGGLRLDYEEARLDHDAYMVISTDTLQPFSVDSKRAYYELLPRLALLYALTETSGMFATITRGYKTGGFNVVFESDDQRSFDPEYSWNYEIGLRGNFFNSRLDLQTALFYIDWKNQQIYQMLPSGQGSILANSGASVSKGAELEAAILATNRLKIGVNYGYTHATFSENTPRPDTDLSGNFIPYIPRHTLFGSLQYRLPLNKDLFRSVNLFTSYHARGRHYWNEQNTVYQSWYGVINLMLTFEVRNLFIDLWSNNLTSTRYHAFSFHALGNHYVQEGKPAAFGINIRHQF